MATMIEEPPTRIEPPASHGGRILKRSLAALGLVLLILILTILFLPASVWKKIVTHVASADLGRQVSIDGKLETHLFS